MESPVGYIKLRILILEEGLCERQEPYKEVEHGARVGIVGSVVKWGSAELFFVGVTVVVIVGEKLVPVLEVFLSTRVLN